MKSKGKLKPMDWIQRILIYFAFVVTIVIIVTLLGYILVSGIPELKPELFEWEFTTENQSMMHAIINTLYMTMISLFVAVPLGIGSAIYLSEYARRGNKLVSIIRLTAETLAGIPSIVYGLFGMLFFSIACGFGMSLLSGSLTAAIMILPLIMRTTEEALISVPDSFREGSFGLGAGRLRTIVRILLPAAMPGILSGIILGIGRIVGETAALIYTSGSATRVSGSLLESGSTLTIHMYLLENEGKHIPQAHAVAVVLLLFVIIINTVSGLLAKRIAKN